MGENRSQTHKGNCPCPQLCEIQMRVMTKPVYLTLNLQPTMLTLFEVLVWFIIAELFLFSQPALVILHNFKIFAFSFVSIEVEKEGNWFLCLGF